MSTVIKEKPVTVPWILKQKNKQKLTMLTAYDYPMAHLLDEAGIDMILIGDSVATVVYGEPNTISITMEDMLRHTKAVSRAATHALVISDMPFLSYQVSIEQAVTNAGRFLKESGAQAVKLEGGKEVEETVYRITQAGIPVVGHIGLTPQSIHAMGSYRMHGKTEEESRYLLKSAKRLAEAGAFLLVLECIEENLAQEITQSISIPTIGIGSGQGCDGQVLVIHDLIGLTIGHVPKFVNPVACFREEFKTSVKKFITRTKNEPDLEIKSDIGEGDLVTSH